MKKLSLKKCVLTGIALFSSLMLLILMSSHYICMSILPVSTSLLEGIAYESGFSMLDFNSLLFTGMLWEPATTLTAISSYITLLSAICGIIVLGIGFFSFDQQKARRVGLIFCIVNVVVSVVYLAAGILVTTGANVYAEEMMNQQSYFKTGAYIPLIFTALLLVTFLLCKKFVPDVAKRVKVATEKAANTEVIQKTLAQREELVVKLIVRYNDIYKQSVISVMDFEKKKYNLMFESSKINLDEEEILIDVLMNYHKLYVEQIVNRDEFEKKKLQLMF